MSGSDDTQDAIVIDRHEKTQVGELLVHCSSMKGTRESHDDRFAVVAGAHFDSVAARHCS